MFFVAGCFFVYELVNFNEHLPMLMALMPVVFLAVVIHIIFYDTLFNISTDNQKDGPINATAQVKNMMVINALSIALTIVALAFLLYSKFFVS